MSDQYRSSPTRFSCASPCALSFAPGADLLAPASHCTREVTFRFLHRAALLLLLVAVPILSTLAKNSWYLPQADTGHYLTGAIKMKVSGPPAIVHREPLRPVATLEIPKPRIEVVREVEVAPPVQFISLTICLQYRSPPALT